jgi:hypothetical protein
MNFLRSRAASRTASVPFLSRTTRRHADPTLPTADAILRDDWLKPFRPLDGKVGIPTQHRDLQVSDMYSAPNILFWNLRVRATCPVLYSRIMKLQGTKFAVTVSVEKGSRGMDSKWTVSVTCRLATMFVPLKVLCHTHVDGTYDVQYLRRPSSFCSVFLGFQLIRSFLLVLVIMNKLPPVSDADIAYSNASSLIIQAGTIFGIAFATVLLRCYVRVVMLKAFGKDDFTIIVSTVRGTLRIFCSWHSLMMHNEALSNNSLWLLCSGSTPGSWEASRRHTNGSA